MVRFGIIGLGNQGSYYALNSFKGGKVNGGVITCMCDNNLFKIKHMQDAYQDDTVVYFDDYLKMLDSGLCDAVLVETPHYIHPEMVIEALKRNIHVICDKPAGVYTKQVKEANEVAKNANVLYTMMFNQRTNCLYRKAKELIEQGRIGKLIRVNWIITNWFRTEKYYKSGSWRASWIGEGGGVLINQCPHQIDLLSWIIGKMPSSVSSICRYGMYHDIEVEDDVTAIFEYDDGATGVFVCSTGEAPGTNRLEIAGTKGKLLCENGKLIFYENEEDSLVYSKNSNESFKAPKCNVIEVETDNLNLQHAGIINNFIKAINKEEPLFVNGIEGINGVELMNAMELSGFKNGQKVTLPIDEDEYLNYLKEKCKTSKMKTEEVNAIEDTSNSFWNSKV